MIYEFYFCHAVGGDRCALPAFAFHAYAKAQYGVSEIQIVFSMSECDKFYGQVVRERSYGFVINPLRDLDSARMLVCERSREKKSNSFFIHSLEWV